MFSSEITQFLTQSKLRPFRRYRNYNGATYHTKFYILYADYWQYHLVANDEHVMLEKKKGKKRQSS